jgi:photosystem II stability/assembly factor-like uncharacterized protein
MISGSLTLPRARPRSLPLLVTTLLSLALLASLVSLAPPSAQAHSPADAKTRTGLSWRDVQTGTDAQFRGLAPVTRKIAWVSGTEGTVLRTGDGGRHWKDVSPGGDTTDLEFRDIEAWDSRHAVILSIGSAGDSRIYRTDDGGRTWKQGFRNHSKVAFYDCLGFWDRRHGLAMSDPVHGKFRVLVTSDGGRSWKKRPASGMPPALDGEFGFAASGTCLVTAGRSDAWIASGGAAARVFHSTDRGRTWTVTDTPVVRSDAGGIFSLAARDPRTLVAVGGDFEKPDKTADTSAYSHDGGATWTAGGDLRGYRSGSAFLPRSAATGSPSKGVVAVGPTGTDVSFDAGATWQRVRRGAFDSVECTGDGACWASGSDGRVALLAGLRKA